MSISLIASAAAFAKVAAANKAMLLRDIARFFAARDLAPVALGLVDGEAVLLYPTEQGGNNGEYAEYEIPAQATADGLDGGTDYRESRRMGGLRSEEYGPVLYTHARTWESMTGEELTRWAGITAQQAEAVPA